MTCFQTGCSEIKLFAKGEQQVGLYQNQIGAIGAAISHFSTSKEPALITMPTGTGKTGVMILLSYLLRGEKVLVITPSQLVRQQIAQQFRTAAFLVNAGILPQEHLPNVYELTGVINDALEWPRILEHDVCVAIPKTLSDVIEAGMPIGSGAFDIVFVDEAHHSRAQSWTNILTYFNKARQILLTATPFRRDKKGLKARIIYDYPLRRAYEEGLFSRINYIPVERVVGMSDYDINVAIARRTQQVYRERAHESHKIIIRTDSKSKANELGKIYEDNTELRLAVIHSKLGNNAISQRIGQLRGGEVDGVICVDMMGEGYDFPVLKIAAIHVPHKSLGITLQFVGRVSRTNTEEGNTATVIASEHDVSIEATQLYRRESDWSIILPNLHHTRIAQTWEEQVFNDSFEFGETEGEIEMPDTNPIDISVENLLPFFHVKIYRLLPRRHIGRLANDDLVDVFSEIDFSQSKSLINPIVRQILNSREHLITVYVLAQISKPNWVVDVDCINDVKNELIILHYDVESSLLFISSTVKENELYDHIAQSLVGQESLFEQVFLPHLKRLLAGWQNFRIFNVGMRSRKTKGNDEAYRQVLGPSAHRTVSPIDNLSYTRGHSFGGGYDPILQKDMLLGISAAGKVWSLDEKKVMYLVEWCRGLARKIADPAMDDLNVPLSELDAGEIINAFPDMEVFFVGWHHILYERNMSVAFVDDDGIIFVECLLISCQVIPVDATKNELLFSIRKGQYESQIRYILDPVVDYDYVDGCPIKIHVLHGAHTKGPKSFLDILNSYPMTIHYEDLSLLSGKVLFSSRAETKGFSCENFIKEAWPTTVNVRKEFYTVDEIAGFPDGAQPLMAIHDYILSKAADEFEVVFYDHASLEIADVIGFGNGVVRFYHCKKQDSDDPRCSVDDMYEVIGQAVKSANWSNRKIMLQQLVERAEKNGTVQKIRKGTLNDIRRILETFDNPMIPVEIVIVQPGLKSDNHHRNQVAAFERINKLLSGAQTYMSAVGQCKLKVMCS